MNENDIIILNKILSQRKDTIAPELSEHSYFEIFAVEEVLKDYDLDYEEIENGIVGGSHDGGIDSFFIFLENKNVFDIIDINSIKDEPELEIVSIQTETSPGFNEQAINNFISTFDDLLDLNKEISDLGTVYNSRLLDKAMILRNTISGLASRFPKIKFSFYYVTKGDSNQVHKNVSRKTDSLRKRIEKYFSNAEFYFEFIGSGDLLRLSRKRKIKSLRLKITGNTILDTKGIICLVKLSDYMKFITDEQNNRIHSIFDVNVREYEGAIEVNKAIKETLFSEDRKINFWWLNNGITIVASKAPMISGDLVLEDPKVVNGLQTSQEIAEYFHGKSQIVDDRLILVRIIETEDESVRNQIIKATNNQTRIVSYSLRATEKIHYDIEQFLSFSDIYYDRQKNFYKNQGKPRNNIVSMQFIAQCFAATILQEPNNARGRPGNLIKDDEKYSIIFNEKNDLDIYLKVIKFVKRIDEYLKKDAPDYAKNERMNLRFHLSSFLTAILLGNNKISQKNFIKKINLDEVDNKLLNKWLKDLWKIFNKTKEELELDSNRVARTQEFDIRISKRINQINKRMKKKS